MPDPLGYSLVTIEYNHQPHNPYKQKKVKMKISKYINSLEEILELKGCSESTIKQYSSVNQSK